MFGLPLLDVGIGLILIYLLLSLACTAANELIAGALNSRGRILFDAMQNLFKGEEQALLDKLHGHPLLKNLIKPTAKPFGFPQWAYDVFCRFKPIKFYFDTLSKPSYIPPKVFALALLDVATGDESGPSRTVNELRSRVAKLSDGSEIRRVLLPLIDDAGIYSEQVRPNVEDWFDDVMDRVSGCYKKRTQLVVFLLAFAVTIGANADTLRISKAISNNEGLRQALVVQAEEMARQGIFPTSAPGSLPEESNHSIQSKEPASEVAAPISPKLKSTFPSVQAVPQGAEEPTTDPPPQVESPVSSVTSSGVQSRNPLDELKKLGVPLGWEQDVGCNLFEKIVGLLLTAFAVSLGAPFWFDMLKKVMNIRAAGATEGKALKGLKS